ncbi:hypothetical protein [Stomatohabitans albus]|uniref:hypothetical protein n=1 Tax=Stomatohabitans albus TaxID=3110766 RepID=UPI00300DA690
MSSLLSSVPQPPHSQEASSAVPMVGLTLVHNRDEANQGLTLPTPPLAYQQLADSDTSDVQAYSANSRSMRSLTHDPLPTPPARFVRA